MADGELSLTEWLEPIFKLPRSYEQVQSITQTREHLTMITDHAVYKVEWDHQVGFVVRLLTII